MTSLSVRGLTVRRAQLLALEDISFSAPGGAVTALLGAPGAGKTTLLAAMAGLLPWERGAIFLGTQPISRRHPLKLLPPGTTLPRHARLNTLLRRRAGKPHQPRADALLHWFGLAPLAQAYVGDLSHGQLAALLTALRLAAPANPLLIDDAGSGLDHLGLLALSAWLQREAREGTAVLVATRNLALAMAADRLILLSAGQVLQSGPPAKLYAEPRDAEAASLTGPVNIWRGIVREQRAGLLAWTTEEGRFLQADDPDLPRPALGSELTLCLRPERLFLLADGQTTENQLEATVTHINPTGPTLDVTLATPHRTLRMATSSWGQSTPPALGQRRWVGWTTRGAQILT